MNAIAYCLDLVLASLLLAALYVGLRLDRKLKALKDSHAGFAGAVAELDAAIVKAQDGLATLKSTANQVETAISDRVQDAKGMTARLDQQTGAAKTAADRLEQLLERYTATPAHARDREALSRSAPAQERRIDPRLRADERTRGGPADEDLFDIIAPALRAARGGRQ